MTPDTLAKLAQALLDDDHGISERAWEILKTALIEAGFEDETKYVRTTEGRFYMKEKQ